MTLTALKALPKINKKKELLPLFTEYTQDMKAKGLCYEYIRNVENRMHLLFQFCEWKSIDDLDARDFVKWRDKHSFLSAATLNQYQQAVTAFAQWLDKFRYIDDNPFRIVQKANVRGNLRRKRRAITHQQFEKLLSVTTFERSIVYLTAVFTGLRRGELSKLLWSDINFTNSTLRLWQHETKNRRDDLLHIHSQLLEYLKLWRRFNPDAEKVFDVIPQNETLKRDLEKAGIPYKDERGRQFDFHAMRYQLCTGLALNNIPLAIAQKIMRHSDVKLTSQVYLDAGQLPVERALDKLPIFKILNAKVDNLKKKEI